MYSQILVLIVMTSASYQSTRNSYDIQWLINAFTYKALSDGNRKNRLLSKKISMGKILITGKTLGNDMAVAYDSVGPTNLISNQSKCNT